MLQVQRIFSITTAKFTAKPCRILEGIADDPSFTYVSILWLNVQIRTSNKLITGIMLMVYHSAVRARLQSVRRGRRSHQRHVVLASQSDNELVSSRCSRIPPASRLLFMLQTINKLLSK